MLLLALSWPLDQTLWPYLLRKVTDLFVQYDGNRMAVFGSLHFVIGTAIALWVGVEIAFRTMGFLMARLFPKIGADVRMAMFDHIQHHSPHYFSEHFAGSLTNKVTDMVAQLDWMLPQFFWTLVPTLGSCLMSSCFLATIHPLFAGVILLWAALHFLLSFLFAKRCALLEEQHGEARSELVGKIVDSFTNNVAVNLFYRFRHERHFIEQWQSKERETSVRARRYVEWMRLVLGIQSVLLAGVALNSLMIWFWAKGRITTGEVAQIFTTTWNMIWMVWMASSEIPTLFQALGISRQALTVMHDPQDLHDRRGALPLNVTAGEILFDNVSFQYSEHRLFRKKSVAIPGGQKVGLVGYSGTGKTTFVNLILRLYPLQEGRILIDGQEIASISLASLRSQISLIPQDPALFHRSLRDNILYGRPDATEEEMIEAAKRAHCHEFISLLPHGYDTLVGERGTKLSGGERQRVAIARTILAGTPILLLDEATSALDSVTESYIQESLSWLMRGRTTIVIAHRLSTLIGMDRILVFDKGAITEDGNHSELLAKGGHYARMWSMQAGGFLPS